MENSLVLTHLPRSLSYHQALISFLRQLKQTPTLSQIADIFCKEELPQNNIWSAFDKAQRQAEKTTENLRRFKIHSVDYWSPYYPEGLKNLTEPPWTLFFLGNLPTPITSLAIVGTRLPNQYGKEIVTKILPNLHTRPLQIISGLAYGIDALVHYCACMVQIPNYAVLGCGLDQVYPQNHMQLASRIIEQKGGLLSELPPGCGPFPYHFPRRNRLIAALANIVWIVQGTARSGSRHTANHALAIGRQVVVTPGDIFSELSQAPNRYLTEGAHPITDASELDLLLLNSKLWHEVNDD